MIGASPVPLSPEAQLETLRRGAVELFSEADLLAKLRRGTPLVVKAGFDPTAPDLHLGHTVLLTKMRQFQDLGHRVVFLIGDFTGRIGDPTGRSKTRPPLTEDEVRQNADTYKRQVFKVLDPDKTVIDFNSRWLAPLTAADVVRLASQYTLARLLERDDFRTRLRDNQPISTHELLYPLFQAYDSVQLRADVELGGQDQLLNLLVGREVMAGYGLERQVVLTTPLLEGTTATVVDGRLTGDKMSKSLGNYVGIEEPPKDIYGKIMSISDALMWRWLELLSTRSTADVAALRAGHPKAAKHVLAEEIVTRYHGADAARHEHEAFEAVFARRGAPETIDERTVALPEGQRELYRVLAAAGLAKSGSDGRRLVAQGAVQIDGERATDPMRAMPAGGPYLFKVGKLRWARVTVQ